MDITKQKIAQCFTQSLSTYRAEAKAQNLINHKLIDMLKAHSDLCFERILEIGSGAGNLTELLTDTCQAKDWIFNDLSRTALDNLKARYGSSPQYLCADAEKLDELKLDPCNLIVAGSVVQWFEKPQHFINMAHRLLTSQGLLLLNTFLPDNLKEIKQLTGVGLTYPTAANWQTWLSEHFTILEWDTPTICLLFNEPRDVLKHLKATGVTATQTKGWTKKTLAQFNQNYWKTFSENNQVSLTYSPLLILAQRKR